MTIRLFTEKELRIQNLSLDKSMVYCCLGWDIAEAMTEDMATRVAPRILGAITDPRYLISPTSKDEEKFEATDDEKTIYESAKEEFGSLENMREVYSKIVLTRRSPHNGVFNWGQVDNIAIDMARIDGMLAYINRHGKDSEKVFE
jgi:hypothetical protein